MRAAKRQWIYTGLAVAPGVAIVRRSAPRPRRLPAGPLLLVGDETARALATPLGDLATKTILVARYVPGSTAVDWARDALLDAELRQLRPRHVLYAMSGEDPLAVTALTSKARRAGATPTWLARFEQHAPLGNTVLPPLAAARPGQPLTAGTYAAWAGAIWRRLG
jgi:hypothetical protein